MSIFPVLAAPVLTALCSATLHVEPDGVDSPDRDGLSRETAFRTLAYACEQLPPGTAEDRNVIRVGKGNHVCTRPAVVPDHTHVFGNGFHGDGSNFSVLVASPDWPLRPAPCDGPLDDETICVIKKGATDVKLFGLMFTSDESVTEPAKMMTGGVLMDASSDITIDTCRFRSFRWFGINALVCRDVEIARCGFKHCSTVKCRHRLGQVSTRYLKDSAIHHCRFEPDTGYGYKGGGHTNVRFHDNTVEDCYFAIESPHENERGFEIDHNELHGAISVPKGGPGADPTKDGFDYSVEIHHNVMTDSYGIEGPRNHLRVHHNYAAIDKPNGRFYACFGGINEGPVRIDHNVIENVDRSLVWVREGRSAGVTVDHNTVFLADAQGRAGYVLSAWSGEHIDDWTVTDNIFVAAWSRPRRLMRTERHVPEKINVRGNVCVNILGVPEGNTTGVYPDLVRGMTEKPWEYYAPRSPLTAGAVRFDETPEAVGPRP